MREKGNGGESVADWGAGTLTEECGRQNTDRQHGCSSLEGNTWKEVQVSEHGQHRCPSLEGNTWKEVQV